MYFNYVICLSGLIQVMVGNVDSICCDTNTLQLLGTSSSNRASKETIYKFSNGNDADNFSDFTADIPIAVEESSDDTVERFRRANGADAPRCMTNLLRARLGLAAAKTRNSADELFVPVDPVPVELVLQTVPVPTQLEPPKLLHKQFLARSPYPISGPEPSCSFSFGSGPIGVNPTNTRNFGNSSASNVITDIRYIELPRQLPPKPSITGMDAVAIRAPDAEHTYTSNLAALVNARLAQHRQITGQYNSVPITNSASLNGNFIVTSIGSEPAPNIAVEADVGLFGNLILCGNLPYVSAVQFDGIYDTTGEGTVSFGCGDPIRENQNLNAKASLNVCKSPDVSPQARTQEENFTASAADEISARFAQHLKSTRQCLQPTSLSVPSCGYDVPGFIRASYYPATETGKPSTPVVNSAQFRNCKCPELPTIPSIVSSDAQISGTNMVTAVAARLAQHKLLTGHSNCEYPNCVSPSLDTSESRTFIAVPNGGCTLPINSISSEPPGVAVDTDVTLSGDIDVSGTLPFMSAVQFQGLCDTVGSGSVAFGAGQSDTGTKDNAPANKRCKYNELPRIPAAVPVPPEVVGITNGDERPTSTTPLAALVSSRLAQHKLLTEQQSSINPESLARSSGTFITNPTNGLPVTSISTEPPGIDLDSDIGLFGQLDVSGDLPFQSAVKFQGLYDTKGSGVVSFGCGA